MKRKYWMGFWTGMNVSTAVCELLEARWGWLAYNGAIAVALIAVSWYCWHDE